MNPYRDPAYRRKMDQITCTLSTSEKAYLIRCYRAGTARSYDAVFESKGTARLLLQFNGEEYPLVLTPDEMLHMLQLFHCQTHLDLFRQGSEPLP